jgi:uncharacterized repeat protein (TIGR01451 family)
MRKTANKGVISVFVALSILFLGAGVYFFSKAVASGADFAGGNIVDAKNVTDSNPSYTDPVSADNGDVVRIRIQVINLGSEAADNTIVSYNLSNALSPTAKILADGVPEKSDYVNINPSGSSLDFIEGSGKKYGPACPSGCSVSDDIVGSGVNVGTVQVGDVNSYQLSIEANVIGVPGGGSGAEFRSGNIFDGGVTGVTWADPVTANPGQVVEFRVTVINDGDEVANNTIVRAAFPGSPSNPIVPTAYLLAEGVDQVTDTFTINVAGGSAQKLNYWEGHAFKWGPGCSSGCQLADNIYVEGINIGNVEPGVENSYQVVFKAYLTEESTPTPTATPTNTPNLTPTPTPTATSTPTMTPTSTPTSTPTGSPSATPTETPIPSGTPNYCGGTCGSNYNCQGGLFCYQGSCRNPSCPSEISCNCPSEGTPPPVLGRTAPPSLPETGGGLEVILSLLGMGSAGVYAFKKFKLI